MKTMLMSFIAAIVIALVANYVLDHMGFSTQDVATAPDVRVMDK